MVYRQQWESRNIYVHKLDEIVQATREREDIQTEVTDLYLSELSESLLAADQHLFQLPLQELVKGPNAHLKAWVQEFRMAIAARDRIFHPDAPRESARFRSWFLSGLNVCRSAKANRKRRVSKWKRKTSSLVDHRWHSKKRKREPIGQLSWKRFKSSLSL